METTKSVAPRTCDLAYKRLSALILSLQLQPGQIVDEQSLARSKRSRDEVERLQASLLHGH